MRYTPRAIWFALISFLSLTVFPIQARTSEAGAAAKSAQVKKPAANTANTTLPEMVWLTYVQGEVSFSPGHNGKPKLGDEWIAANVDQVMEDGYTLVTQNGRAEIEFEDGSVVYLAEHSSLEFDKLQNTAKGMYTEVHLVTGMATVTHSSKDPLYLHTSQIRIRFIGNMTTRVENALDGVRVRQMEGVHQTSGNNGTGSFVAGDEAVFQDGYMYPTTLDEEVRDEELDRWQGKTVRTPESVPPSSNPEWDAWVAARLQHRRDLIAEGLKESEMKEPIPGLAGMMESGKFFDCQPYGKCWQPNPVTEQASGTPAVQGQEGTAEASVGSSHAQNAPHDEQGQIVMNRTLMTRCPQEAWRITRDPQGHLRGQYTQYGPCFAGSWNDPCQVIDPVTGQTTYNPACDAYVGQNYSSWDGGGAWVVGRRHRHECHIVKTKNHGLAFVPRHPLDKTGHPPVNAKHGIFVMAVKKGKLTATKEAVGSKGVQLESRAPGKVESSMEKSAIASAAHAEKPVIEAKLAASFVPGHILGPVTPNPAGNSQNTLSNLHFDYKSGNFVGKTGSPVGGSGERTVVVAHGTSGTFHGSPAGNVGGGSHGGTYSNGNGHSNAGSSGGHSSGGSGGSSGGHSSSGGSGGGHSGGGGGSSGGGGGGGGGAAGGGHH
jgi:hypothetical protein